MNLFRKQRLTDTENKLVVTSLMAQVVKKNLPAMQETWVWFLGWEDALEKEMAAHSSILAWRIPWTEKHGRLQSSRLQRTGKDWATNTFTFKGKAVGVGG